MRNILKKILKLGSAGWLAIILPLVLIVPNIALSITEPVSFLSKIVNIVLPLGVFILLSAVWKRIGITTLLSIPLMCFAGFQIVLLYLYGDSIIAVDMFLNVVTTNVSEATELLANLLLAMGVVIILYVPTIVWGIVAIVRHQFTSPTFRHSWLRSGGIITVAGVILVAVTYIAVPGYRFVHEVFPVNVIYNLKEAFNRYDETRSHDRLSADFTYNAREIHPDSIPETYIFVIGETSRGDNWQLGGYARETNLRLSREPGAVFFSKSISESNTTHKSVPMLISFADAENFSNITEYKSLITAFKEAGFSTTFISNQLPNRSYTEFFGNEADTTIYVTGNEGALHSYDDAVFPYIDSILADNTSKKKLIVVHTYGSHFKYFERYPREFARFTPDQAVDASRSTRPQLINAYDNSIVYVDYILSSIIDRLKKYEGRSGLVYASDHGEDIFDDDRERFLHASPTPTYWQLHQATLVWLSETLTEQSPEMMTALKANSRRRISPQKSLFPTIMQMAGVKSDKVVDSLSLVSAGYNPAPAVYLNDHNEALPLNKSGLKQADVEKLDSLLAL